MRWIAAPAGQLVLFEGVRILLLPLPTQPQFQKPLPTSAVVEPPASAPPRDAAVPQQGPVPALVLFVGVPLPRAFPGPAELRFLPRSTWPGRSLRDAVLPRLRSVFLSRATPRPIAAPDRAKGRLCRPHRDWLSPRGGGTPAPTGPPRPPRL